MPDLDATMLPFAATPTLILVCNVVSRRPRTYARDAPTATGPGHLKATGVGDTSSSAGGRVLHVRRRRFEDKGRPAQADDIELPINTGRE